VPVASLHLARKQSPRDMGGVSMRSCVSWNYEERAGTLDAPGTTSNARH
jgi:hypothetical protein